MTDQHAPIPARVLGASVEMGPVDAPPADATALHEFQVTDGHTTWLLLDDIRVMVSGTERVVIELSEDGDPTLVEPMLYGWVMRVLLLNHGTFNLHASLVRIGDEHVAIGGRSGAGKSTTVVALAQHHGASLVIDDILPIDVVDGRPVARPFARPVHLTHEAVARVGGDLVTRPAGIGPRGKVAVELASDVAPVPVDRLVVLIAAPDDDPDPRPLRIDQITGAERLRQIVRLSNSYGLASFGPRAATYFAWSTALAAALPTLEIVRSSRHDTLDEVCRVIMGGTPTVR